MDHGTTRESICQETAFLLGIEVGRRAQGGVTAEPVSTTADDTARDSGSPAPDIDLIDRADRVRTLLDFLAGYALLVDACEDGATVDQLKMGYLGIPLLEASEVVKELAAATRGAWDESGGAA